eukprot:2190999-Prorocentrum_lima.AAC.1
MKQKEERKAQLQLKQSRANHEEQNSVLEMHAKTKEQQLLVVYKKKFDEISQLHAAQEDPFME